MAVADQLGTITWWGFTPALDLQDTGNHNHIHRHRLTWKGPPPPFVVILSIFKPKLFLEAYKAYATG